MIGAYLVAGVPVGLLIGRARGIDLRAFGSGNIGASNAVRALGRRWGLLVFALDVAKAALPVAAAVHRYAGTPSETTAVSLVALAAILGHVFPIYLRFRGGKGVACAFGVFLVLAPKAALLGLFLYLQTLWLTRISAVGSLTAAAAILALAWADPDVPFAYVLLAAGVAGLIWERHRENLGRILAVAKDSSQREAKLRDKDPS
ncbi:glycerol-3-phosphate acyltransferase [Pseudenhygromyxa sp. WMMC2535]|nr:glycerol-3-phosphate acyltransferase [Pseudenhygromyxa sp. WMMC2535]NVB38415.1 glycerol-3-phosphate acyltransferase [Pseudenhygromyxa sp. WMMC2535]